MAKYNLLGNRMYPELAKELDFDYKNNGSLVLALHEEDIHKLEALMENGRKNGVEKLEIVGRERLKELESILAGGEAANISEAREVYYEKNRNKR